jgi:thiamine-phosphate pyrophosphorylase
VTRTRALKALTAPLDWRLCFIADSEAARGRDVLELISEAVGGGATLIQLRGKAWTTREFLRVGLEAALFLRPKKIPLIINDRLDIALACRAGGIHLGQEDLPLPLARRILGKRKLIGISVATPEEARIAEKEGADYLGIGPVFPTLSKQSPGPFLGLEGIRRVRDFGGRRRRGRDFGHLFGPRPAVGRRGACRSSWRAQEKTPLVEPLAVRLAGPGDPDDSFITFQLIDENPNGPAGVEVEPYFFSPFHHHDPLIEIILPA